MSQVGLHAASSIPVGALRVLNTLTFDVEYTAAVSDSRANGPVELWGTRDGGISWSSFGVDADGQSPFRVRMDREGRIGLRMTLSQPGAAPTSPARGDAAELWVKVDVTPPEARLTAVEQTTQGSADCLIIEWQATDDNCAPRPVTLLRGDDAHGPWTPIASALENSGQYTWMMQPDVPRQFHLRIEVRDTAGNVGQFQTAHPISLRRQERAGRIVDVRPVHMP
jgi:hypothetical protein